MKPLSLKEIGTQVGAKNDLSDWEDVIIEQVAFDTRQLKAGSLFVPLSGNQDGHDYIQEAIKNGASASFWSKNLEDAPAGFPVILVDDCLQALQDLAAYYLASTGAKVIGITGSNGKTTTKDMVAAIAATKYKVHKTKGNFNNHIGLPITVLEMPEDTEVAVLEMGMDKPGEIKELSLIAKPDIGIITMIGEAHIEFFGSRDGIAATKMEITKGLKPDGVFIYPGSEPLLKSRVAALENIQLRTFGLEETNDIYAEAIQGEMDKTYFKTNLAPHYQCMIPVLGNYNVTNSLAALMAGISLGISFEDGAEALKNFDLTKNRTEWIVGKQGVHILNDTYNANPTAMNAVLDSFSNLSTETEKIVVLGDMLELGDLSDSLHAEVREHLDPAKISQVYLFGKEMLHLKKALAFPSGRVHYYETDKIALIADLKKQIQAGDYILVKASNGMGLGEIVEALK